jgi:hypothetical protein
MLLFLLLLLTSRARVSSSRKAKLALMIMALFRALTSNASDPGSGKAFRGLCYVFVCP